MKSRDTTSDRTVAIVKIGQVEEYIVDFLVNELPNPFYKLINVHKIKEVLEPPLLAWNSVRRQFNSSQVLEELLKFSSSLNVFRVLGVADFDAYVPGLNFVFGQALVEGKACVIYLPRLRISLTGNGDRDIFLTRVLKEAVHELGHTLGLGHCANPKCVMRFSNSILDVDFKEDNFCDYCRAKVVKALLGQ